MVRQRRLWSAALLPPRGYLRRLREICDGETGDIIALSPPLVIERAQIGQILGARSEVLRAL